MSERYPFWFVLSIGIFAGSVVSIALALNQISKALDVLAGLK
jgi:hypothetical protein